MLSTLVFGLALTASICFPAQIFYVILKLNRIIREDGEITDKEIQPLARGIVLISVIMILAWMWLHYLSH